MGPRLTILGLAELENAMANPDPGRPISGIVSIWSRATRASQQLAIDHYLQLFARRLPGVPVLALKMEDLSAPRKGLTAPTPAHMRAILSFARRAIAEGPADPHLLLHCRLGVSRSAAGALAILAQANPGASSRDLIAHLLSLRPGARPNPLMVRIADEILGRTDSLLQEIPRRGGQSRSVND